MPYKTKHGSHYHMTAGCHGADIACDTAGLQPCRTCCQKTTDTAAPGGLSDPEHAEDASMTAGSGVTDGGSDIHRLEGQARINMRERVGRLLAFVLRHRPDAIGLSLDEHGWADVSALIAGVRRRRYPIDMAFLEEVVRFDSKQRYAFNDDRTKIRANQGHSIPVDVELPQETPPDILYHGTASRFSASIEQQGLLSQSRLYVHLSANPGTAITVGARHGKPIVYQIDCKAMTQAGHKFYLSKNGVWLTEEVPPQYLRREDDDGSR